jgi:hypothetical protein
MRRSEGLIGGIVFIVATLLAFMLSGCEAEQKRDVNTRERGFKECEKLCGSRPVAVQWDRYGSLTGCRCDVVISTDAEVE